MRTRRIENEWLLLEALQEANPGRFCAVRHPDAFALQTGGFPALRQVSANALNLIVETSHAIRVEFPRYYPSMPAEVYLDLPVFHPNVHPDTGFVCLWTKHRVEITLEQTLAQLQRVLAWSLLNTTTEHVMQPTALHWSQLPSSREQFPLEFIPFVPVLTGVWTAPPNTFRRRLS